MATDLFFWGVFGFDCQKCQIPTTLVEVIVQCGCGWLVACENHAQSLESHTHYHWPLWKMLAEVVRWKTGNWGTCVPFLPLPWTSHVNLSKSFTISEIALFATGVVLGLIDYCFSSIWEILARKGRVFVLNSIFHIVWSELVPLKLHPVWCWKKCHISHWRELE